MKPNIVLIVMDTARAKNLPMYGYERNTSPFLNKISKQSVVYKNAYSNSPWTLPSHASLFTGLSSSEHRVLTFEDKLSKKNLMQTLREQGYYTFGISNNAWVCDFHGFNRGFDEFINNLPFDLKETLETSEIFEDFKDEKNIIKKILKLTIHCIRKREIKKLADIGNLFLKQKISGLFIFNDKGARKTNKILFKKIRNIREPFFIFINYLEPHHPYEAPKYIEKEFLGKYYKNYGKITELKRRNSADQISRNTDEDRKILTLLYDSGIYYLDSKIKELYQQFKKKGLLKNTIFIFTSDHGEFLGEHGLYSHMLGIYEEVLKIPLIIKYPNNQHKEIAEATSLIDVHNLILSKPKKKNTVVSEYFGVSTHNKMHQFKDVDKKIISKGNQYMVSMINGNRQLIEWKDGYTELIHLVST